MYEDAHIPHKEHAMNSENITCGNCGKRPARIINGQVLHCRHCVTTCSEPN